MIIIVNKREKLYEGEPFKIYCGRPSILCNRFSHKPSKYKDIMQVSTLEEAIGLFETDFFEAMHCKIPNARHILIRMKLDALLNIHKQYGKLVLECWCARGEITTKDKPYVCHGQVIAEYLEKHLIGGK